MVLAEPLDEVTRPPHRYLRQPVPLEFPEYRQAGILEIVWFQPEEPTLPVRFWDLVGSDANYAESCRSTYCRMPPCL